MEKKDGREPTFFVLLLFSKAGGGKPDLLTR